MSPSDKIEIATLELWKSNRKTVIHFVYNAPNNDTQALDILLTGKNTILLGDFNAPHTDWDYPTTSKVGTTLQEFTLARSLLLLDSDDEDRYTNQNYNGTVGRPDLAFAHVELADNIQQENLLCFSDKGHRAIKVSPKETPTLTKPRALWRWNFKKAQWQLFKGELEARAANVTLTSNPHKDNKELVRLIVQAAGRTIPRSQNKPFKPFWNATLESLSKKRNTYREMARNTPTDDNQTRLATAQAELTEAIKTAKETKFREFLSTLNYRKDGVKAHQFFSRLCGKWSNKDDRNEPLTYKGKTATSTKGKAEIFCKYFRTASLPQCKKPKKIRKPAHNYELKDIYSKPFSSHELDFAIHQLDLKKAPGPDGIHAEFLKNSGPCFRRLLLQHVNNTWGGQIPADWKLAYITPVLKKDKDSRSPLPPPKGCPSPRPRPKSR
jgi:hypothetical protein